jgi:hypothetical protein
MHFYGLLLLGIVVVIVAVVVAITRRETLRA